MIQCFTSSITLRVLSKLDVVIHRLRIDNIKQAPVLNRDQCIPLSIFPKVAGFFANRTEDYYAPHYFKTFSKYVIKIQNKSFQIFSLCKDLWGVYDSRCHTLEQRKLTFCSLQGKKCQEMQNRKKKRKKNWDKNHTVKIFTRSSIHELI